MDVLDAYRAARSDTGLVDRSSRGRIALHGRDRLAYLHGLLTNDIVGLQPGRGCYAAYLTPQGRMIADMRVLELGDMTLLDVDGGVKDRLLQRFDDLVFSEDVRLSDLTGDWTTLWVLGPRSAERLAGVLAAEAAGAAGAVSAGLGATEDFHPGLLAPRLAGFVEHQNARFPFRGDEVVVAGSNDAGLPGFDVYLERDGMTAFRDALVSAGATAVSQDVAEVLRVEAGRPAYGVDMDDTTIPLEAGIEDRAISMTKGCYVGQEVIVRVLHRGHGRVARRLVGVVLDEGAVPAAGAVIRSGDQEVGRVTSAVMSPTLGQPIVMGYVHRDHVAPGTAVSVGPAEAGVAGSVMALPFVETAQ